MAVWKCRSCGESITSDSRPQKCSACGASHDKISRQSSGGKKLPG